MYVQIPGSDTQADNSQLVGAHRALFALVGPGDTLVVAGTWAGTANFQVTMTGMWPPLG